LAIGTERTDTLTFRLWKGQEMRKTYAWAAVVVVAALMILARMKSPDRPTGFLKLVTPSAEIQLQSDSRRITLTAQKEPVKLFMGTYTPTELSLTNGQFRLVSEGPFGRLHAINVSDNRTTALDFGPPLKVKADVGNPCGPDVTIGMTVTGKAGEEYSATVEKNGLRRGAPAVRILDEKGKVLESGTFKFG
jgi:hypothetical protein